MEGLERLRVRDRAAITERRAEGQAGQRRRHVVDLAELDVQVGDRAGLGDVDVDAGLDVELRLLRILAAVFEVQDVHGQRNRQVVAILIGQREAAVLTDLDAGARLRQRVVRIVGGHEGVDERVDRDGLARRGSLAPVGRDRLAGPVEDRLLNDVALAEREVGQERTVHRERLGELRPLVERVERIFEIVDADAELVEFVLQVVDELLELVEILFGRAGVRLLVLLQLGDHARDDDGHLIARERTVALELPVGVAVDQTVGREALDVLIRPVIRRHVRERRCGGSPAHAEHRTERKARRDDQACETLHESSKDIEATAS